MKIGLYFTIASIVAGACAAPEALALPSSCVIEARKATATDDGAAGTLRTLRQEIGKRGISRFIKYDFDFNRFEQAKRIYANRFDGEGGDSYDAIKTPEEKLAYLEALVQRKNSEGYQISENSEDVQALVTLTRKIDFNKGLTNTDVVNLASRLYMIQFDRLSRLKTFAKYRDDLAAIPAEIKAKRAEAVMYGHDLLTSMDDLGLIRTEPEKGRLRAWFERNRGWLGLSANFLARAQLARALQVVFKIPLFLNAYVPDAGFSALKPVEIIVGVSGVTMPAQGIKSETARIGGDLASKEINRVMTTVLVAVTSVAFVHGVYHHWKYAGEDVVNNAHKSVSVLKSDSLSQIDLKVARYEAELQTTTDPKRAATLRIVIGKIRHAKELASSVPADPLSEDANKR